MMKFYLYYSGVTVLVCFSASVVFSSVYRNIQGGIWAGLAALIAAQCFVLHCLYFSNKLPLYYKPSSLQRLNVVSFVIVLLCSTFLIWYIFTMVYWKIPLFEYEKTPIFPCVFTFIAGKWGLHMYKASKEYSDHLLSDYSPVTQPKYATLNPEVFHHLPPFEKLKAHQSYSVLENPSLKK